MDQHPPRRTVDEIRTRRLVLVDGENRPRLVMEVVDSGAARNGGLVGVPRVSLLNEQGRPVLVLEVDGRGKPRVRVGDLDHGAVTEVEAGLLLLGFGGNTRVMILARDDGGVLHLCDEDGAPVLRLPSDSDESSDFP